MKISTAFCCHFRDGYSMEICLRRRPEYCLRYGGRRHRLGHSTLYNHLESPWSAFAEPMPALVS
jgi:hypothetical protein